MQRVHSDIASPRPYNVSTHGVTPLSMGCGHSLQRLGPEMYQRTGSTPLYEGCVNILRDMHPAMYQHMGSTPLYNWCAEVHYTRALLICYKVQTLQCINTGDLRP